MDSKVCEALGAATESVRCVHKGVYAMMHAELVHTCKRMSTQWDMEFPARIAIVRSAFKRDSVEIHRMIAHNEAVVGTQVAVLQFAAQVSSVSGAASSASSGAVGTPEAPENSEVNDVPSDGPTVGSTELQGPDKQQYDCN